MLAHAPTGRTDFLPSGDYCPSCGCGAIGSCSCSQGCKSDPRRGCDSAKRASVVGEIPGWGAEDAISRDVWDMASVAASLREILNTRGTTASATRPSASKAGGGGAAPSETAEEEPPRRCFCDDSKRACFDCLHGAWHFALVILSRVSSPDLVRICEENVARCRELCDVYDDCGARFPEDLENCPDWGLPDCGGGQQECCITIRMRQGTVPAGHPQNPFGVDLRFNHMYFEVDDPGGNNHTYELIPPPVKPENPNWQRLGGPDSMVYSNLLPPEKVKNDKVVWRRCFPPSQTLLCSCVAAASTAYGGAAYGRSGGWKTLGPNSNTFVWWAAEECSLESQSGEPIKWPRNAPGSPGTSSLFPHPQDYPPAGFPGGHVPRRG